MKAIKSSAELSPLCRRDLNSGTAVPGKGTGLSSGQFNSRRERALGSRELTNSPLPPSPNTPTYAALNLGRSSIERCAAAHLTQVQVHACSSHSAWREGRLPLHQLQGFSSSFESATFSRGASPIASKANPCASTRCIEPSHQEPPRRG